MEEQDELILGSDEDSSSENEERRVAKPHYSIDHGLIIYVNHTKTEFIICKALLVLSTTLIVILLPLYMEVVSVAGNVYSLLLTNSMLSTIIFAIVAFATKFWCSKYRHINLFKLPLQFLSLGLLTLVYFGCAILVIYALDRKKVVCHLQDPIMGLVLLWSFLLYFMFCQTFMGLKRIFAATAIIGGVFISVDYSVCNEFKCRGFDREHISDETGQWTWKIHALWTIVYIIGLALFSAYFTLLERRLSVSNKVQLQEINNSTLSTVSHSVSTVATFSRNTTTEDTRTHEKFAAIHLAVWLHVFGLLIIIAFFWIEFIPQFGKGTTAFLNDTLKGIVCHFDARSPDCNDLPLFSWLFVFSYVVFVVSSVRFLILTQSAVYTIATMTTALPLAGIWWSLVHMLPIQDGLYVWAPALTGELISSFLGLPVVATGLYVFYKCHFQDYLLSQIVASDLLTSQST